MGSVLFVFFACLHRSAMHPELASRSDAGTRWLLLVSFARSGLFRREEHLNRVPRAAGRGAMVRVLERIHVILAQRVALPVFRQEQVRCLDAR